MTTDSDQTLAGIIAARSDPPGLSRQAWRAQIAANPALRAIEGEGDAAEIVVEGEPVGRMGWSSSGANELDVYGAEDQVADVAWNVAAALDGHFVTLAELTRC